MAAIVVVVVDPNLLMAVVATPNPLVAAAHNRQLVVDLSQLATTTLTMMAIHSFGLRQLVISTQLAQSSPCKHVNRL